MSKSRYGTIENYQADLESVGQRAKYRESSLNSSDNVNANFGVSNPRRLNDQFDNGKFSNYDPLDAFKVDQDIDIDEAVDFKESVSLNYTKDLDRRTYNLEDVIESVNDRPQRGAPNIRIDSDTVIGTDPVREKLLLSERSSGLGVKYNINQNNKSGNNTRQRIGKYISISKPIHRGGPEERLGNSDPYGRSPTVIVNKELLRPAPENTDDVLDQRRLEIIEERLRQAPGQPPRPVPRT